MWTVISGIDGSGKQVISEWFIRENFQNKTKPIKESKDGFFKELLAASSYLSTAVDCADLMHNSDIFTIRSFWENGEIYLPLAKKFEEITTQEYETGVACYESMKTLVAAPTCFVYCKIDLKMASDRALLKGQPLDQNRLKFQMKLYEEFFDKISIPVLEIDMTKQIDAVLKDLDYSVMSIKSSSLDAQTIWRRCLF